MSIARSWQVLLIGGASGVGKTSLSYPLARRFGVALTEADDLNQMLLAMTSPAQLPAVHFWREHPEAQDWPAAEVLPLALASCEEMTPGLEAVIANRLAGGPPLILEGDYILPSLAAKARFMDQDSAGRVRAVFVIELDAAQIAANFAAREGRAQHKRAEVSALHSAWLKREAEAHGLPAIAARPWATAPARILAAIA